mmetsp:Transcript_104165/g.334153  ORF Transcript_104165/g.334153 Transcript_104165/m.334153 type:complete len:221 (+) Transcript_104165:2240-2902(+)
MPVILDRRALRLIANRTRCAVHISECELLLDMPFPDMLLDEPRACGATAVVEQHAFEPRSGHASADSALQSHSRSLLSAARDIELRQPWARQVQRLAHNLSTHDLLPAHLLKAAPKLHHGARAGSGGLAGRPLDGRRLQARRHTDQASHLDLHGVDELGPEPDVLLGALTRVFPRGFIKDVAVEEELAMLIEEPLHLAAMPEVPLARAAGLGLDAREAPT